MTQVCAACQTVNRDAAKYCRACAGKLALSHAAASAIDFDLDDPFVGQASCASSPPPAPAPAVPEQTSPAFAAPHRAQGLAVPGARDRPLMWLSIVLVLAGAAFVFWYAGRAPVSRPHLTTPPPALSQAPAAPAGRAAVSLSPSASALAEPATALAPATATTTTSATDRFHADPAPSRPGAPHVPSRLKAGGGSADAFEPAGEAPAQAVALFYRALSAGDGSAAAALVTPAKRGIGPFNDSDMSRFYRSFKEPLVIRSIRQIDANVVEARYSYRASSTPCEGTALVETEQVAQRTLIRKIRANC